MSKILPPKTKRYCTICERMHWYIYDPMLGHSYCCKCKRSSLFSRKEKTKEMKKEVENDKEN